LKRIAFLLATACVGCEAILGFGETSMTPGSSDASTDERMDTSSEQGPADGTDEPPTRNDTDVSDTSLDVKDASEKEADVSDEPSVSDEASEVSTGDESSGVPNDHGWSPLDLSALVLWLDASVGIETQNDVVTTWHDRSRFAHRAVAEYPSLAPTLETQGIGGYPGVAFAGKGDFLAVQDAPSLRFGTHDFVVEVVMRHTTPIYNPNCFLGYGLVFNKSETPSPFRGPSIFANFAVGSKELPMLGVQTDRYTQATTSPVDVPAYNDNVPRLVAMLRYADVLSLRINGSPISSVPIPFEQGTSANLDAVGINVRLGAAPSKVQCLRGVITELVAAAPVTLGELNDLENYLLRKYAGALGSKDGGP
jgi:hypothetical protein